MVFCRRRRRLSPPTGSVSNGCCGSYRRLLVRLPLGWTERWWWEDLYRFCEGWDFELFLTILSYFCGLFEFLCFWLRTSGGFCFFWPTVLVNLGFS